MAGLISAQAPSDKWEFYKDPKGEWRWRRTASNGNIVGASTQGYVNKWLFTVFLRKKGVILMMPFACLDRGTRACPRCSTGRFSA